MKIKPLILGDLKVNIPIIQGGMGVGVSLSGLASAVANEGGLGVISGAQIGFKEPNFGENTSEANLTALEKEIKRAKEKSPKGVIGLNLMVAMNQYEELVKKAVESKIDAIISGAGLPLRLPEFINGAKTKIAPIVSSAKAANLILGVWDKKYKRTADFVVVEGPEAGGHLGFSQDELRDKKKDLKTIVKEVIETIKIYEQKYMKQIPVIAAGGIFTGKDMAEYLKLGASGVQIATRFIATEECDADINYKRQYLNVKESEIEIIKSPVGMPGRAIRNEFINRLKNGNIKVTKCYNCIKKCNPSNTPFCITQALINAVNGNVDEGLLFTGSQSFKIKEIVSVKEVINEILEECLLYV